MCYSMVVEYVVLGDTKLVVLGSESAPALKNEVVMGRGDQVSPFAIPN